MLNGMRLDAKLVISFLIISCVSAAIGVIGYVNLGALNSRVQEIGKIRIPGAERLQKINSAMNTLQAAQLSLIDKNLTAGEMAKKYEVVETTRKEYKKALSAYNSLTKNPEEKKEWKQFILAADEWNSENKKYIVLSKEIENAGIPNPALFKAQIDEFKNIHYNLANKTGIMITERAIFTSGDDYNKCPSSKWLNNLRTQNAVINTSMSGIIKAHRTYHGLIGKIKKLVFENKNDEALYIYAKELIPFQQKIFEITDLMDEEADKVTGMYAEAEQYARDSANKFMAASIALENLMGTSKRFADAAGQTASEISDRGRVMIIIASCAVIIGALIFGVIMTSGVSRPIKRVVGILRSSADETTKAVAEVAASAKEMREGAAEQRLSLRDAAGFIERLSAMTKQNNEHAETANQLAQKARENAEEGNRSMAEMKIAMQEIDQSSDRVRKIIKSIEEIAFQTNCLALNAAVEAARAGEHGRGFAVVAEEVRNLAKRSAESARDTSALIEDSINKTKKGTRTVQKAEKVLNDIAGDSYKVEDVISKISSVTKEQDEGIAQIANEVTRLGQLAEKNILSIGRTHPAAGELTSQTEFMHGTINELDEVVSGSKKYIAVSSLRIEEDPAAQQDKIKARRISLSSIRLPLIDISKIYRAKKMKLLSKITRG